GQNSELELSLNKASYLESEPVWLEAKLRFRNRPLFSPAPHLTLLGDLKIAIINEKGDTVTNYCGHEDYYSPSPSVDSIYYVENLLLFYGDTEFPYSQMVMKQYLPEGEYKLFASMRTSAGVGESDYLPPAELHFSVRKAEGEELESRNALINMYKLLHSKDKRNAATELLQSIKTFESVHPNSVYLGAVLNLYLSYSLSSCPGLSLDSLNKIVPGNVYRYPENYFNYGNLNYLILRYRDRGKSVELLEKLTTQYSNRLLGKFACELLIK
ncbi:MAG: hypothetical protein JNK43_06035, partial [Ignavibacteria bacterium]|nr:hypothetical protein [Ignavibacteria bacterium]